MPRIAIVIPTYNPGPYLAVAVDSVIAQSFDDWEMIVVDDGSPEDVSCVARMDPRIRLLRKVNGGQAEARNFGIAQSESEFVAFLDQDDRWHPEKLQRQLDALMRQPQAAACHTQFELIDASGSVTAAGFGRCQTFHELLAGSGIAGSSTVMGRRAAIVDMGGFQRIDEPAEDYGLFLRLSRQRPMCFVESVEAQYRVHGKNQTSNYARLFVGQREMLKRFDDGMPRTRAAIDCGVKAYGRIAVEAAIQAMRPASTPTRIRLRHALFAARYAPTSLFRTLFDQIRKRLCHLS